MIDDSVKGKRIKLIWTPDEYTNLKPGDMGTASGVNRAGFGQVLLVDWDNGSRLGLLEGIDQWEWVD